MDRETYLEGKVKLQDAALLAWENLFYPFDGGEVSQPDWTFVPEIKKCIIQGKKARRA